MTLKAWLRKWLGIPNPTDMAKWQVGVVSAIQELRGNQMNEQDQIAALTAQVTAFANAFAAFIQTATTSKQNDANRIADLTAKWKAALASDAVDQSTIAQSTASNTDLNNAASVHDATVATQLQAAQDALTGLQTQLTTASSAFAPTTGDTTDGTNSPPTNSVASTDTSGTTPSTGNSSVQVESTLNLGGEVPVESTATNTIESVSV